MNTSKLANGEARIAIAPARPDPSDESLVARVALRDVDAFALLYDRYARAVFVLAAHTLGGADAEEVVQDVFFRLWQKAGQFDAQRGSFAAWFMTAARHGVLDRLQQRSQQQRMTAADDIGELLAQTIDARINVEDDVWQRACAVALLRALQDLPAEQRRAIVLAYFGGLSHSSIAQSLGWPLGTVKKRIRLGMTKLRAALAQLGMDAAAEIGSNYERKP